MIGVRAHAILARSFVGALLLGLSGCFSFTWSRDRTFEPLPSNALQGLEPGHTTLEACLARLGAPLYVWEYKRQGAALAWGAGDDDAKRFSVSVPLDRAHASFSYGRIDARLRGAVLLFDEDLVLEEVKEGCLRDIARQVGSSRSAPRPGGEADAIEPPSEVPR
jgi:hypothetical protein